MFRDRDEFACALQALDRRDFARAVRELDALLEGGGRPAAQRAFLLNKRGVARVGLELAEPARADFEAALAEVVDYAPALTNLGNLLLDGGRIAEAIGYYERAIAGDGEYALAHFNLGVAYKRAGRVAEGVAALRRAQRLEQRAAPSALRWYRPFRRR